MCLGCSIVKEKNIIGDAKFSIKLDCLEKIIYKIYARNINVAKKIKQGLANGDTIRVVGKVDSAKNINYYLVDSYGNVMRDSVTNKVIIWEP